MGLVNPGPFFEAPKNDSVSSIESLELDETYKRQDEGISERIKNIGSGVFESLRSFYGHVADEPEQPACEQLRKTDKSSQ